MKRIVVLGSSGSIGESTLRVAETLSSRLSVTGLAVKRNYKRVLEQARRFNVGHVAVADPEMAGLCAVDAPSGVTVYKAQAGVEELAARADADIVVCGIVGIAGLKPVMAAVRNGTDIALATKEVLVAAGGIVTGECAKRGSRLLPVDSEHSAIFQCLEGYNHRGQRSDGCEKGPKHPGQEIRRILLTASGGPFAFRSDIDLDKVTVDQVLEHPRWSMGKKVTVDSASLMNKGLEIMEAHWLFNMPIEQIDVVVHPESIVHSLVEFVDGTVMAQLSIPDMRFAIQYALTYPERLDGVLPKLDLAKTGGLHFWEPDTVRFPCLTLAREAAVTGGTMPAVLNAANEIAVQKFLERRVTFSGIWRLVEGVMENHTVVDEPDIDDVIEADAWARRAAQALCGSAN